MNQGVTFGLLLLALLGFSGVSPAEEGNSDFDSFLEAYTATWNTHDGDALAAMFTEDADLIMGNLPRIEGRVAIAAMWNVYFSRISEKREGEFELLSLRDIASGVRLVNVRSKTFGTDQYGEELETRLARGTWVLVRSQENWLIAAMRGLPEEGEKRLSPGTDN